MSQPSSYQIALIGNPNCGKTTIFNNLTGTRQKVGNWPGVTVEKKTGQYLHNSQTITITDLPGLYSISPAPQNNSLDQEITNNYIKNNSTDLYINILDASNLKRNLYLSLQLRELGLPCLVILNMTDKSQFAKLNLNPDELAKKLSEILNYPVITTSGTKDIKKNIIKIKNNIHNVLNKTKNNYNLGKPSIFSNLGLNLPSEFNQEPSFDELNKIIANLSLLLPQHHRFNNYGLALEYIEAEIKPHSNIFSDDQVIYSAIAKAKEQITELYQDDPDIIIADLRYKIINQIYQQCAVQASQPNSIQAKQTASLSNKIDNIVLNKYLGIPIFFLLLYIVFELAISLGEELKPLFEIPSNYLVNNFSLILSQTLSLPENVATNFNYGLATGLATVVGFIPQIALIFILLTCLEDSGYMARAAFVMDRLMLAVGLPGKSFLPLIISFGCNVPAIMSTRTLQNHQDRILTCLMSPFMSCSARLAIFIVFASAFFPSHAALMVFILYVTGIIIALITGLILKKTILLNDKTPFVLELPSYNVPNIKTIFITSWQHIYSFITRAGKLIIPICIFLQFVNNIDLHGHWLNQSSQSVQTHHTANIDQSILAQTSKTITPLLSPIGIEQDNWPATVGLITGSLAKEVVIGTLNTLYSDQDKAIEQHATVDLLATAKIEDFSVTSYHKLSQAFPSTAAAFAYCLFILLYIPCLSTFSILIREIGRNWAVMSLLWSLDIAYCSATIVYQSSTLWANPLRFISIVGFIVIAHLLAYKCLKSGKLNNYFNLNKHAHTTAA